MKEDEKANYYKIELPAPWNCEIKEERSGSDGRIFLGEEYMGAHALWVVEPKIKLEAQQSKDFDLYVIAKVKGIRKGVSKVMSAGRVNIGKWNPHKKALIFLFKEELTDVELSILEDLISIE